MLKKTLGAGAMGSFNRLRSFFAIPRGAGKRSWTVARIPALVGIAGIALIFSQAVSAQTQTITEQVAQGCKNELETYCKNVTRGEGRVLACLYAYQDKLSGQCEYALYDGAVRLERAINALTYLASECREDIATHCKDVQAGEGRILQCLKDNQGKLSGACAQAFADVEVE
jgi:Cysteine rich repeat